MAVSKTKLAIERLELVKSSSQHDNSVSFWYYNPVPLKSNF
jgi:hypothetical protein